MSVKIPLDTYGVCFPIYDVPYWISNAKCVYVLRTLLRNWLFLQNMFFNKVLDYTERNITDLAVMMHFLPPRHPAYRILTLRNQKPLKGREMCVYTWTKLRSGEDHLQKLLFQKTAWEMHRKCHFAVLQALFSDSGSRCKKVQFMIFVPFCGFSINLVKLQHYLHR